MDHSLEFAEILETEESFTVIPGLSMQDPKVQAANQKHQACRRRIQDMHMVKEFMEAMQVINTTWDILDSIDEIDDVDETTIAVDDDEMENFSD